MKKILLCLYFFSFTKIYAQHPIEIHTKRNEDNSIDFSYTKREPGSFTLLITFSNLSNTQYYPSPVVISAISGNLFRLRPDRSSEGISYAYNYRYIHGAYNPGKVDSSFIYILPFEKGKYVQTLESYNVGEVYFKQARSKGWKAYHFKGDIDSIFAIRKGIVTAVTDRFDKDTSVYFTSNTNNITVEHADGTLAYYKGFSKGKTAVKPGQEVLPHTYLGSVKEKNSGKNGLALMLSYISQPGFKEGTKSEITFITPLFYTTLGTTKLTHGQKYGADYNDKHITKEMSRRERKAY